MVVRRANRWGASKWNPPILKAAFGNNDERLSLSRIMYATLIALIERTLKHIKSVTLL